MTEFIFCILAGLTLETSILKFKSFTGIFLKVLKHKCITAILQISFLERIYFGVCMHENSKVLLEIYVTGERVQKGSKLYFLKCSISNLFHFQEDEKYVFQASS